MSQKRSDDESNLRRKLREYERAQGRTTETQPSPVRRPVQPQQRQPPPPQQPQRGQQQGGRGGLYVPWWGILIVVGILGAATCGLWFFVLTTSPDVTGDSLPELAGLTPTFVVITATPTPGVPEPVEPTVQPVPDTEIVETPTPVPTSDEPPPPSEDIVIGGQVTIFGTEGDGLAIRQGPGLDYAMVQKADGTHIIGRDGEVFTVEDGPRENDGHIWWYLTDPNDPDRFGWAAQEYMLKVPGSDPGPLQEVTAEPTEEATE
jgi:hypothetical protein